MHQNWESYRRTYVRTRIPHTCLWFLDLTFKETRHMETKKNAKRRSFFSKVEVKYVVYYKLTVI